MLLVMDVGNSNTVLGLYEGEELRAHWRIVTGKYTTRDELRVFLKMLFRVEGFDPQTVRGCCISSVVPPFDAALTGACRETFGVEPLVVGPGVKTGLAIQVENPKEVGADRIVNCVGALEAFGGPLIVIDFGTATTFDVLTERAEYVGGVIVPGIQTSADALFEKCAKLPRVEIVKPDQVTGKNTVSHIRSGLTYGYAGLVDGLVGHLTREMKASPTVVATGGLAGLMADLASGIDEVDPWLTLRGLKAVYLKNEGECA
jgi:type III pantothenate kinase